jgi:hypothetical protein
MEMENVGLFYGHLVYFGSFGILYIYFTTIHILYIYPVSRFSML